MFNRLLWSFKLYIVNINKRPTIISASYSVGSCPFAKVLQFSNDKNSTLLQNYIQSLLCEIIAQVEYQTTIRPLLLDPELWPNTEIFLNI